MAFAGPIASMTNSHTGNLQWLGRKRLLKKIQEEFPATKQKPLTFSEGVPGEYWRFQERLHADLRRDLRRRYMVFGITLVIMLASLYWVVTADYTPIIEVMK